MTKNTSLSAPIALTGSTSIESAAPQSAGWNSGPPSSLRANRPDSVRVIFVGVFHVEHFRW